MKVTALLLCLYALTGQHTAIELAGHKHVTVVVEEGSDVTLPCSLGDSVQSKAFDWKKDGQQEVFLYDAQGTHYNNGRGGQDEQFKGRVSHFQDKLKYGNFSIKITNTKVDDSGNYTCEFPNLQPGPKFHVKLVVRPALRDRSGEVKGASPEPYVMIHVRDDRVLLQCEVRGASPQPKLQWQDSDGNILPAEEPQVSERGGRYTITLQAFVTKTKTNRYSCVATQEVIHHVTEAEITLPAKLFDTCSKQEVTGWIGGFCLGVLTLGVLLAFLVATKFITIQRNNGSCLHNRGNGL